MPSLIAWSTVTNLNLRREVLKSMRVIFASIESLKPAARLLSIRTEED
jgi:hypothetical protein